MTDQLDRTISTLATSLMTAVVRSGCMRYGNEADYALGETIMRQELKAFICADEDTAGKYVDERALALSGQSALAMRSLTAACVLRIANERGA
jgi:hypothetical protein